MFYNFSELHATLSEKRFPSQVSFFYQIHPNPPNPFDRQNPKSTKHEESFFIYYLAAPLLTLGYCRGDSLSNPMLITTFPQMGHSEILWKIAVKKDI